ncbi:4Fe-4S ferredoxin [Crassaminicella thermophila]|uniref:4Fe-4S ferredoxin n=1 Tax=Crassaminicella thermophila TaxID=2599308 RepID=A0A5C0SC62_CRATE|nr:4Fe-4S binding protein [Crassaminicella thermophila]QEK11286.1 4Fe-4S ferredoxin [Crassaminicella thermophila]
MAAKKSHQSWSWILMVLFFILAIVDVRFGLLGFVCMAAPIYHALRGRGKIHCSKYCPRGSILGNFLKYVSLDKNLPKALRGKSAKNILLTLMMIMFSISLYHAFQAPNVIKAVGFAIFRLMVASSILAFIMGVIFKPRSWCQVCPMGHTTALIKQSQDRKKMINKKAATICE